MAKKIIKYFLSFALISVVTALSASAATPYETYTYSYSGKAQTSPDAYEAKYEVYDFGSGTSLNAASQIVYDDNRDLIIIADTGNNRILITDSEFNYVNQISSFMNEGIEDSLNAPQGVFIDQNNFLYVADTQNGRILLFDEKFAFKKEFPEISADILPENFRYNPKSVAVDSAGNIYVVSINTNMGVIALDPDGNFTGFIGAQRISISPLELLRRSFMTEEQLSRLTTYVPVEFSSLAIDEKGFIYVTCSDIDRYDLYTAVSERSASSVYAPIKKLNPSGTDVLRRNGFFPPVGDVDFDPYSGDDSVDPSQITEVKLIENGMYILLDSENNKMFFYDSSGNLLYAFGGNGEAVGLYSTLASVAVNGDLLYTLDSADNSVTVSEKSDYGKLIDKVVGDQENREYDKASELWQQILNMNNNFDIAYLGIGKICLEEGKYEEAMQYFKIIDNKNYYSKAYKLYRQDFLDRWGIAVFAAVLIAIFLVIRFFGYSKKYNLKSMSVPARKSFKDEVMFGFHVMFHPFQGYYALKNEKRGSLRAANMFLALTAFTGIFSTLGSCYLLKDGDANIVSALSGTVFPLLLWCVSNVCFTSLMDGKGKLRDVYIAACYSTVPYILVTIVGTVVSYGMVSDELSLMLMVTNAALIWSVALIMLSGVSVHEYSFGKNLSVIVLTVFGIAFILFVLLIFTSLIGRMVSLFSSIADEISYRS